jgi:histone H3/H4
MPPKAKKSRVNSKNNEKKNVPAVQGIKAPTFKRLAYRSGVFRISKDIGDEARIALEDYLRELLHDTFVLTKHAKRKTVMDSDVISAANRGGIFLKTKA